MPTNVWVGGAARVARVRKFTPAGVAVGNVFTVTRGRKSVSFTATAATAANVTAGLAAAWNASTETSVSDLTAADATTFLTLTADRPGEDFVVSSAAAVGTGGGSPSLVQAAVTGNAGPEDASTAANWSLGTVPASGDDVVLGASEFAIKYGLAMGGVLPASIKVLEGFEKTAGLPAYNAAGDPEDNPTAWRIGPVAFYFEQGPGAVQDQIVMDFGGDPVAISLVGRDGGGSLNAEALRVVAATHASNTLTAAGGSAAVATGPGESATLASVTGSGAAVRLGAGVTLGVLDQRGGESQINSGCQTLRLSGESPVCHVYQTAAVAVLLDVQSGTVYDQGTGAVAAVVIGSDATVDRGSSNAPRTYATIVMAKGATLLGGRSLAYTTLDLQNCGLPDVTLALGENIRLPPRINL